MIHPSSVNNRRRELAQQAEQSEDKDKQANAPAEEKQLYAFVEKRRNDTVGGSATTFLVTTTRLDPLVYILFGAHNVEVVQGGLECDGWLPIKGDLRTLDDIWRLKTSLEMAMLRVFEGILMSRHRGKSKLRVLPREAEDEAEWEDEDDLRDYSLSKDEVRDLDEMTNAFVNLLNAYSDERIATQSVHNSRAGTPVGSPFFNSGRPLPPSAGPASGRNTPYYQSRPGTPSRFRRA
jgi:small subunit ribosomal protein S24e